MEKQRGDEAASPPFALIADPPKQAPVIPSPSCAVPKMVISEALLAAIPDDHQPGQQQFRHPQSRTLPPISHLFKAAEVARRQLGGEESLSPRRRPSLSAAAAAPAVGPRGGPLQHQCTYAGCMKVFPTKSRLNRHLVVHTGDRPFICPAAGCLKSFSRRDNMMQHYKSHGPYTLQHLTTTEHEPKGSDPNVP